MALGLFLAKDCPGLRVLILERRPRIRPILKPEILQPAALDLLDQAGVLASLKEAGDGVYRCQRYRFLQTTGEPLCSIDYGALSCANPYTLIAFPDRTQQILLSALSAYPNLVCRFGSQVKGVIREEKEVKGVYVEEGNRIYEVQAGLTVGADGSGSLVRRAAGFRAKIDPYPESFLAVSLPASNGFCKEAHYYVGAGSILAFFPIAASSVGALFMVKTKDLNAMRLSGFSEIGKKIVAIEPKMQASIAALSGGVDAMRIYPCIRVWADRWVADGTALLGDAAHCCHPHTAQGSTQALLDAKVLSQVIGACFQKGDYKARELAPYEQQRRKTAKAVQTMGDRYEFLWNTENPVLASLRNRAFRTIGKNPRLLQKVMISQSGLRMNPLTPLEGLLAMAGIAP